MTQPNLKELAKQGDVKALTVLMNRALQPKGMTAKVRLKDRCLLIMLESAQVPEQQSCVALIKEGMRRLAIPSIKAVRIFGRQQGDDFPAWTEDVQLDSPLVGNAEIGTSLHPPADNTDSKIRSTPKSKVVSPQAYNSIREIIQNRYDPIKAGFMLMLAIYGGAGLVNYDNLWFIHNFDLIIHEAGHVIFMFFGDFIHALGGTLLQLMVPIGITGYFFYHEQRYSGAVTLFWTALNLFDVARYMKDARAQELPLLYGDLATHDWNYLFSQLNLLEYDQLMGGFVHFIGFLLYVIAIAAGFYFAGNTNPTQQTLE